MATRLEDLGTLTVRYARERTGSHDDARGHRRAAGLTLTYQSRNRAIIFAKPHTNRDKLLATLGEQGVTRLATVVGLWNFAQPRTWVLYADGKKIEAFPHRLKAGQRILIHDGVSYLAILPLPASDLGRDVEIEIAAGIAGKAAPSGAMVAPALTISMFNLRRDQPIAPKSLDLRAVTTRTYGGLVLEMGDAQQHGSFEAFVRHIDAAELTANWNEGKRQLDVAYRSGGDLLEAGFTTDFGQIEQRSFPDRSRRAGARHPLSAAERRLALPAGRAGTRHELGAAGHDWPPGEGRRRAGHRVRPQSLSDRRSAEWCCGGLQSAARPAGLQPHRARRRHVPRRRQGRTAACRIPAVGEGLRHQPCAETRSGRATPRNPSRSRDLPRRRA